MDQLPRLGKRELICLLLFTYNHVVSVWRGFLFHWVLGMGYVILLWHSLSLPYNYFENLVSYFSTKIQQISAFVLVFYVLATKQSLENCFGFPMRSEMPTLSAGLKIKRHVSRIAAFENSLMFYTKILVG